MELCETPFRDWISWNYSGNMTIWRNTTISTMVSTKIFTILQHENAPLLFELQLYGDPACIWTHNLCLKVQQHIALYIFTQPSVTLFSLYNSHITAPISFKFFTRQWEIWMQCQSLHWKIWNKFPFMTENIYRSENHHAESG